MNLPSPSDPASPDTALAWFELMFGRSATASRPERYHLMLLGESGGVDLHFDWTAMLDAAPRVYRHEKAFAWAGISQDGRSVHCSLLDCVIYECARLNGNSASGLSSRAKAVETLETKAVGSHTFIAYALFQKDSDNSMISAALRSAPDLLPGCLACPIPAHLSMSLSHALHCANHRDKPHLVEASLEALDLSLVTLKAPAKNQPHRL